MCILKTGFLFAASEFGNHYLFQFAGIGKRERRVHQRIISPDISNLLRIGDDDDTPFTTAKLSAIKKGDEEEETKEESTSTSSTISTNAYFSPRWFVIIFSCHVITQFIH